MMRRSIACSLLMFTGSAFGGPFGLEMGQSLTDLREKLQLSENGKYIFTTSAVPQPHPDFDRFTLIVTPEHGLCKVQAISKFIPSSSFGTELHGRYVELRQALERKYGKSEHGNRLMHGSIWKEQRDWMMSLLKKDRKLAAFWSNAAMPDDLRFIHLEARAFDTESGVLVLAYEFANADSCLSLVSADKNSAL